MTERSHILRHAGTILIGQLAVMAFGVTDTIVAARYADTALASLSVGSATYISVHVALMGIVQALLPIWAELQGAKKYTAIGQSVRQALYIVLLTSTMGMLVLLHPSLLLEWAQVPTHLQTEVKDYLTIVAFGLPASLLFRLFGTLNQSLGRPRAVTTVQVAGLVCKIPLSILLALGLPGVISPLGLVGLRVGYLVSQYHHGVVCNFLAQEARLLQALRFFSPHGGTRFPSARAIFKIRHTQWTCYWCRGHFIYLNGIIYCATWGGRISQPSNHCFYCSLVLHGSSVSLHRSQCESELLARCGSISTRQKVATRRLAIGDYFWFFTQFDFDYV
jgi:MATE family multidrug resistance protein